MADGQWLHMSPEGFKRQSHMEVQLRELVQEVSALGFVHALQLRSREECHKRLHKCARGVLQRRCKQQQACRELCKGEYSCACLIQSIPCYKTSWKVQSKLSRSFRCSKQKRQGVALSITRANNPPYIMSWQTGLHAVRCTF